MADDGEQRNMVTKNIRLSSYALLITLALSACTDGPTITPQTMQDGEVVVDLDVTDLGILDMRPDMEMQPQGESVLRAGALDLQYVEALNTLRVFHDEHHRFDLPLSGLMMGTVDEVGVDTNYDPYHIYDDNVSTTPEGLVWHPVVGASVSVEEGAAVVALEFESLPAGELRLTQSDEQRLTARISAPEGPIAFVRIRAGVSDTEAFYGLGEVFDDVNHRGKLRAMQLEFDGTIESANNEAHVPIPVLYGHTGWGLFVESLRPAIFDVAQSDDESIDAVFGTGTATAEGLQFHIFTESHPLDLTRHYYELTGYPKLPAQWAYGPWIWRDENEDEAQIRSDIQIIRDLDLATSGYWVDRPYASAVNSFDWDPRMFDDPQGMIDFIHSMGFRFALWHAPYIGVDDVGDELTEATLPLRETAEAEGYYPPSTGALTSKWGRLVDLTNPEAYAWWQALIRRYSDMGVEGYKLDYGEDIVPGYFRLRSQWEFFDGSNDQTMHARYQTLFHQVYAETLPETGGFLLCRAATWGGQTNGIIIWPGDLNANFAAHRELVTDGDRQYVAVGGLGASVIAGLSLGPSGFPFYGSDTGGYRRSPPTKEVFTRWFQQTALRL